MITLDGLLASLENQVADLLDRVDELAKQVGVVSERLEQVERRRRTKPRTVSEIGVCALNPEIDSGACPNATVYRHQQGCQGKACRDVSRRYYADYRAKRKNAAD